MGTKAWFRRLTDEDKRAIEGRLRAGETATALAKEYKISESGLRFMAHWLQAGPITYFGKTKRERVEIIKILWDRGATLAEMGTALNITRERVRQIIRDHKIPFVPYHGRRNKKNGAA